MLGLGLDDVGFGGLFGLLEIGLFEGGLPGLGT